MLSVGLRVGSVGLREASIPVASMSDLGEPCLILGNSKSEVVPVSFYLASAFF